MYLMGAWMLLTSGYFLFNRMKRLRGEGRFDRSMLGDLEEALSIATYQVRISSLGRWNVVPIAAFSIFGILSAGKSFWIVAGILIFFVITYLAAGWEHGMYERRKAELEALKRKLQDENGKE